MEDVKDLMTHPEGTLAAVEAELANRDAEIETICRWAAARAGVLVMAPKLSTTALIANDAYMVSRIAAVYGHTATAGAIIGFLGGLGGSLVSALLTSVLPTPKLKIPLAVCLTYAVGKCAKTWVEGGMPMPGDFSEYRERLVEIIDYNKTTIKALMDSPMKSQPLGDEGKDFLAEAGVDKEDFLGLSRLNLGNLLNGDTLASLGSLRNVVLGLATAAVAGVAGKAIANSDKDYIADAKHALSGIGSLLATVSEAALDLAAGGASSAVKTTDDVKSTVLGKLSDFLSVAGNRKEDVVERVSDFIVSAGDKREEVVQKVSDLVDSAKDKKEELVDLAKDKKEELADKASDLADKAKDKADEVKGKVEETIDEAKSKLQK
ncbi:YtxH domain-containing protein [Veillonella criceti]|uniref:Uncharacterized protein n=1 Tax=Veillonella criceti TaxID=103891 RepID=A0A380NKM1_9FIRM|nr:YtxH domain-containing protein [Veillonella criceti]SUP43006.1 Uncharacterised protein [Veillonella criceti]